MTCNDWFFFMNLALVVVCFLQLGMELQMLRNERERKRGTDGKDGHGKHTEGRDE
jgi:hypothetical protein